MTYEKRSDAVEIPENLSLEDKNDWSCHICTLNNPATAEKCTVCQTPRAIDVDSPSSSSYKLNAVVLHQGSAAAAGHYVSNVKEKAGWKRYNDSRVTSIGKVEALSKAKTQAYLLFFVRTS
eukprot:CAMPEP_0170197840 /NCGR_PEP_ID=MMETSP0040_2-20121228/67326_1 /TAXON_ID=641309 /ORGANISM="Lotharella oceanica, Strain CCMP622" /LENGTH=120 /DNA_ID=CAMNT_0010447615 /DNA_START=219 /DNA_END=581 /DNA_ORIENTATION=+